MLERLLRAAQVMAFRRAWAHRHTGWFVAAAALWMVNRARRPEGVAYRTRLEPGEGLVVTTRSPGRSARPR